MNELRVYSSVNRGVGENNTIFRIGCSRSQHRSDYCVHDFNVNSILRSVI